MAQTAMGISCPVASGKLFSSSGMMSVSNSTNRVENTRRQRRRRAEKETTSGLQRTISGGFDLKQILTL